MPANPDRKSVGQTIEEATKFVNKVEMGYLASQNRLMRQTRGPLRDKVVAKVTKECNRLDPEGRFDEEEWRLGNLANKD